MTRSCFVCFKNIEWSVCKQWADSSNTSLKAKSVAFACDQTQKVFSLISFAFVLFLGQQESQSIQFTGICLTSLKKLFYIRCVAGYLVDRVLSLEIARQNGTITMCKPPVEEKVEKWMGRLRNTPCMWLVPAWFRLGSATKTLDQFSTANVSLSQQNEEACCFWFYFRESLSESWKGKSYIVLRLNHLFPPQQKSCPTSLGHDKIHIILVRILCVPALKENTHMTTYETSTDMTNVTTLEEAFSVITSFHGRREGGKGTYSCAIIQ